MAFFVMSEITSEDARFEIKFVSSAYHLADILYWLRYHGGLFVRQHADRRIHNVYFDTIDLIAYQDNVSGIARRSKVRYRWYGEEDTPAPGVLEVKIKRNVYGWKLRFAAETTPYEPGATWTTIRRSIREQVGRQGRVWIDANPVTVLINCYQRRYFVSNDGAVRVTVDNALKTWDQRFRAYPNLTHRVLAPDLLVVEFKSAREDRETLSRLIQGIPIRASKFSKYIRGVEWVGV